MCDPDGWLKVILTARKPPSVVQKWAKWIFFLERSCWTMLLTEKQKQEVLIYNKKFVFHKVQWLKMQWLHYESSNPLLIYYKYSNHDETKFSQVNVMKRKTQLVNDLDLLYP